MTHPGRQRGQIMLIILGSLFLGGGAVLARSEWDQLFRSSTGRSR